MSFISICIVAASGDPDWSDWRLWVALVALLAFYYAVNSRSAKRRRRALSQLAPSLNFSWSDTMPETPRGVAFLRPGLGGEFSNAMTGSRAGCEVTVFDFEYETGVSARTERTHAQTIAAFRSAHSVLPVFQFAPETVMHKMSTVGSAKQFKFEAPLSSVPAPVGHYLLRSREQTDAKALFDSEMLEFLQRSGNHGTSQKLLSYGLTTSNENEPKEDKRMALTRDFREAVKARADRDPAFRKALLAEGIEHLLAGDVDTGKAILRDYINATVGFGELAEEMRCSPKSIMRMFSPSGSPRAQNLLEIVAYLQQEEHVQLKVKAAAAGK
jgi:DNA-binding phage protein